MAVRGFVAFVGRVLFAFLFLSSGFQKLTSFNPSDGGPVMDGMTPKMDNFLKTMDHVAGIQLPIPQVSDLWSGRVTHSTQPSKCKSLIMQGSYKFMLAFAIFLELAGGLLFILNSTWGAVLLVSACIFLTSIGDHCANALYKCCSASFAELVYDCCHACYAQLLG